MATIDVNEILRGSEPAEKRFKPNPLPSMSTANATTAEILAALESDNANHGEIDETTVKRLFLNVIYVNLIISFFSWKKNLQKIVK